MPEPTDATAAAQTPRPGRYTGRDGDDARIELRVDDLAISGDVCGAEASGTPWLASFRTIPDAALRFGEVMPVIMQGRGGASLSGKLTLHRDGDEISFALVLGNASDGLPFGRPIRALLRHQGAALRRMNLSIAGEAGVPPAPDTDLGGGRRGLAGVLAAAGIDLISHKIGGPPLEPPGEAGWSDTQLDVLLAEVTPPSADPTDLSLTMLWLSRSNRRDKVYNGLMFDNSDSMQRQGVAVFADTIRSGTPSARVDRKLVQAAAHEIGHALNLVHRNEIGQPDSLSVMNLDWAYRGGGLAETFWRDFDFRFDPDELAFLRHAALPSVAPGGAPFRSVPYWEQAARGYEPLSAAPSSEAASLQLLPPETGPVFDFAQPLLLGLRLTNTSAGDIAMPSGGLDFKSGSLDMKVTRESVHREDEPVFLRPPLLRCISEGSLPVTLAAGATEERNVNLTSGAHRLTFAEPGGYRITASIVLRVPGGGNVIVRSSPLRVRIAVPASRRAEAEAIDLLDPQAARFLALAGGATSHDMVGRLHEIAARREREAQEGETDAVAACLRRALLFHHGRAYPRRVPHGVTFSRPDKTAAAECRRALDAASLSIFDGVTRRETEAFLASR